MRRCEIDDDAVPMVNVGMGSVTANTYHLHAARQEAERRAIGARKRTLHEAAIERRRKRKRGGPK